MFPENLGGAGGGGDLTREEKGATAGLISTYLAVETRRGFVTGVLGSFNSLPPVADTSGLSLQRAGERIAAALHSADCPSELLGT